MRKFHRIGFFLRGQTAKILGLTTSGLRYWQRTGKIRYRRDKETGWCLFPRDEVIDLAEKHGRIGNIPGAAAKRAFELLDAGKGWKDLVRVLSFHPNEAKRFVALWEEDEAPSSPDLDEALARDHRRRLETGEEEVAKEHEAEIEAWQREQAETLRRSQEAFEREERAWEEQMRARREALRPGAAASFRLKTAQAEGAEEPDTLLSTFFSLLKNGA